MRRLLITGASGTLGGHVALVAQQQGWEICGTYYTAPPPLPGEWHRLDVGDRQAVMAVMRQARPSAVVHTAFQQHGAAMWAATAEGAAFVAQATQALGVRLVHVSSDAIFDGTSNPYTEAAKPCPLTPYGAAKAAAETAVSTIVPQAAIVRTSWIISREPVDPHTRFILDLAAGRRSGQLFTDQYRCPIGVDDLAAAIMELAAGDFAGIINVAGADALSRYDLGRVVARVHHVDAARLPTITTAAHAAPVVADVRLDSTLARSVLRTRLRGIYAWFGVEP